VSTLATVLATAAGIVLIAAALRDVFDVLFHEMGTAVLSHVVIRAVWRVFHWIGAWRSELFTLAGPFALIAVVATWALLLVTGWAMVYWPHVPQGFNYGSGVGGSGDFVDATYVSLVSLSTLGFGDISPSAAGLRVITPLEALIGFGLLTASISWLLAIYPVLSRRRSLAYEIQLLVESQEALDTSLDELGERSAEAMYAELTSRIVAVERDLATLPVAYYFPETDDRFSLAVAMPSLLALAERGASEPAPEPVRLRATMLREAVDDFAHTVARVIGAGEDGSTEDLLGAYRRDHMR
jgi:hypothetical protein